MLQPITQTSGLELQEFAECPVQEPVGIHMIAFVYEIVNDSGHYKNGEVENLMPNAQLLPKEVEGYSRTMNNLVVLLHAAVKAIGKHTIPLDLY